MSNSLIHIYTMEKEKKNSYSYFANSYGLVMSKEEWEDVKSSGENQ